MSEQQLGLLDRKVFWSLRSNVELSGSLKACETRFFPKSLARVCNSGSECVKGRLLVGHSECVTETVEEKRMPSAVP